jgi:LPS-assembly lipoprotein
MVARILTAVVVFAAAAVLAGCGFRPLYGESSAGSAADLAGIYVDTIPNRAGQKLHNLLLARLNPRGVPERPDWRLSVSLDESISELAIRRDERATRANLTIAASFTLTPTNPNDHRRFVAAATSTNSYNRLQSDYATLAGEEDARDRALRTLAEEIRLRIAAALENPGAMMTARVPAPAAPAAPSMAPSMAPSIAPPPDRPLLPGR